MAPINKISGNLCSICRTIISSEPGNNLMCQKCQQKAIELLQLTMDGNFLPEELQDNIEEFLNNLEDE